MDGGNQEEHIEKGDFRMTEKEFSDSKGAEKNLVNGSKLYMFVSYEMSWQIIARMFQQMCHPLERQNIFRVVPISDNFDMFSFIYSVKIYWAPTTVICFCFSYLAGE